jgi:hypothetical protein
MPRDLAPLARLGLLIAVLIPAVAFFAMLKGGAFRGESGFALILIGGLIFAAAMAIILALDSAQARSASYPNPLHPDNRKPTEPPSS